MARPGTAEKVSTVAGLAQIKQQAKQQGHPNHHGRHAAEGQHETVGTLQAQAGIPATANPHDRAGQGVAERLEQLHHQQHEGGCEQAGEQTAQHQIKRPRDVDLVVDQAVGRRREGRQRQQVEHAPPGRRTA
jgi:hypothetical protein